MENKKRNERFFGLHFDFHADPERRKDLKLGAFVEAEEIEKVCRELRPDFIQVDCKGHGGYTSYPTRVGTAGGEFAKDPLKIWREATAKHGVALYVHYSGVWDTCYLLSHPEDAWEAPLFADAPKKPSPPNHTSVFGKYVTERMIPQLMEVADRGVDGVWVDGDCWACTLDASDHARNAFYEKTGVLLQKEDITPETEHFEAYRAFCRDGFRAYIDRYAKAMHAYRPNFKVCSNWAYSEQMPERVTTDVDFLSGDFSPYDAFHGALFSGRILASQGRPWDLISWAFRRVEGEKPSTWSQKHPVQLMQEAAAILSIGGGYQAYFRQHSDASIPLSRLGGMKALADFCHIRREFCHGTKTLPNAVIFNSAYDHYKNIPSGMLFGNHWLYETHRGWVKLLADGGHSFEIREEHNLLPILDAYKMVVCPEIITGYEKETKELLLSYAERGGVLVLSGIKILEHFGISHQMLSYTEDEKRHLCFSPVMSLDDSRYDSIYGDLAEITAEGETLAKARRGYDVGYFDTEYEVVKVLPYGKGKIIAIGLDVGFWYQYLKTVTCRKLSEKLLEHYKPIARVKGSHRIVLNVTEKNDKLQLHLVNSSGEHSDRSVDSFDDIPPIYQLSLEVALSKAPCAVTLQPSGESLAFTYENGLLRAEIPKVELYEIAELAF